MRPPSRRSPSISFGTTPSTSAPRPTPTSANGPCATDAPPLPDLITHVAVGPMNVHDGAALEPALADVAGRGVAPDVVLADSHYGSDDNLGAASGRGVEVASPAMPAEGSEP